ncbi:MAG: plastocyanin/azurin family copper-binding protein [Gemmatimonadaceae bacterium]
MRLFAITVAASMVLGQTPAFHLSSIAFNPDIVAGARAPKTHVVNMVLSGEAYRFEPATITVSSGDHVKFVMLSGGPHNVAFEADSVPTAVKPVLSANMPDQISPLAGPLLDKASQTYTVSFAGVKPGTYKYFCMPHALMNMTGIVTVK